MTVFSIFGFFAIYFFYLKKWSESELRREHNFAYPESHETLPHSLELSSVVGFFWGVFLVAGMFWGFTYIRYPSLTVRNDWADFLLALFPATIGLSYAVVFKLGKLKGMRELKDTEFFISAMPRNDKKKRPTE